VDFVFAGEALEKQIVWQQDVFPAGTYSIEIYIDGQFSGTQKISLY
jgi:hypothetical protein